MSADPGFTSEAVHVAGTSARVRQRAGELFHADYAKLVRAMWMLSGSREVAEDIVQDVFARMLTSPGLADADDPSGYIYRAVMNQLRSWQRRQHLERRHASLFQQQATDAPPEILAFRAFLTVISDRQRTAVVLHYYCDLPVAEVARLMGCRRGTVSVLLSRALKKAETMKEAFES